MTIIAAARRRSDCVATHTYSLPVVRELPSRPPGHRTPSRAVTGLVGPVARWQSPTRSQTMRDLLDHVTQAPIEERLGVVGEHGSPDEPREQLERRAGGGRDAHARQRALVFASLLLAPKDPPTHRRWA